MLLALSLVLVSFAAYSPGLHGWLHGDPSEAVACQGYHHHHHACTHGESGEGPVGEEEPHICGVVQLMNGGMLLFIFVFFISIGLLFILQELIVSASSGAVVRIRGARAPPGLG